ncbi:hypothetical protein ACFPYJ_15670 [Paenibacillus solisilvae]|uniref:Isochorismatase-like domain-containing protein n=1 Tax=Paenibacillus solisilvae TaxID=2486751 RepID=A0ABW0VXC3_9BACL
MRIINIPTNYYQQFDADYSLDVPGEGYGGWKKARLELDLDHTAVVVMHAMDYGTKEQVPGLFNACQYIPNAYRVGQDIFPGLLGAIRNSDLKLFHVVSGGSYYQDLPGYKKMLEVVPNDKKLEQIAPDPVYTRLKEFKRDYGFPGKHNLPSYDVYEKIGKFPAEAVPEDDEEIFENEDQLFEVCKKYEINHLIYVGFNVNWCMQFSPGGIMHISKRGILCSTIRQAVTAVENKETARNELGKEQALWTIAVGFGLIYDLEDFVTAITPKVKA